MTIKNITLLTTKEYEAFRGIIPSVGKSWWLKDRGSEGSPALVLSNGDVFPWTLSQAEKFVRPALHISGVQHQIGEKVAILSHTWTVLSVTNDITLVICDDVITMRAYDSADRNWENSDIKRWLEQWLKKRLLNDSPNAHKRYKRMNEIGLAYLQNKFLREWLTPMSIVLPVALVLLCGAHHMNALISLPPVIHTVAVACGVLIAIIAALSILILLKRQNKTTGLRHLLNLIFIIASLALCWNNVTSFGVTAIIAATVTACINYRYLRIARQNS